MLSTPVDTRSIYVCIPGTYIGPPAVSENDALGDFKMAVNEINKQKGKGGKIEVVRRSP